MPEIIMAKVTKHGRKRIKERANLQSKAQIRKNIARALKFGIKHNEAKENLKKWMDKIYFGHQTADAMRIYNGFLYIFKNGKMLTMYPIPENLKANIQKYIDKEIYERYNKMNVISDRHNQKKQQKKLKEKQQQFHERVLIYDITEYINTHNLNIKVTGINISETLYTIRYIPYDKNTPTPVDLVDYIKDTSGRNVILRHIKNQHGQLIYESEQNTSAPKNEKLIYSTIFDEFKI